MNIIFDLDGTLINSLPGIAHSLNRSLEQLHLPTHDLETIKKFIGSGSRVLCQRAVNTASESTIDKLNVAFQSHYQELWKSGTEIYPGILDLLKNLRTNNSHELSILSNKPHPFTIEIANQIFPKNTFHTILGQREGIEKKPNPKGIYKIIKQSNLTNQNACLIGDSIIDLKTANNASIKSIAVTWGFESTEQLASASPDHIVHSVSDLKALLQTF